MSRGVNLVVFAAFLIGSPVSAQPDKFFDSDGVAIRYVERGQGEPVLLVHGILGSIEGAWLETGVLANLARDYHVVAFDLRGHGKSGIPRGANAYGEEMAGDILRLLDRLKIQKAHIVGYSLGAFITAKVVADHQSRFATVTLGGGAPVMGEWNEERRQRNEKRALEYERDELRQIVRSYADLTLSDTQIKGIRIPVLTIIGSDDPALPNVRALQRLQPRMQLIVINGATHAGPQRAHARPEFVKAIREFISSHRSTSR